MLEGILKVLEIVAWFVAFVSILTLVLLIADSGGSHTIKKDYGSNNDWDDWDDCGDSGDGGFFD